MIRRAMIRRLLNFLTALSLLLFAATCVLWVRSHFVQERLRYLPLSVNGTAWVASCVEAGQTKGVLWLQAYRTTQPRPDGDERDAAERDLAVAAPPRARPMPALRLRPACHATAVPGMRNHPGVPPH